MKKNQMSLRLSRETIHSLESGVVTAGFGSACCVTDTPVCVQTTIQSRSCSAC